MATRPTTTPDEDAGSGTYARLAAPFDNTFHDTRGGVELEYITGEQCVSRLNDTLGVAGWSFQIVEHGINVEADEVWVLGRLLARIDGQDVERQQFGSQKLKRSRSSGMPLDIGFDLKGGATDALKKCASLIGVGLYLSKKEQPQTAENIHAVPAQASAGAASETTFACDECGAPLKETKFKDGTAWGPAQLAGYGRRKHGKVLCMDHYRAANEARRTELLSV